MFVVLATQLMVTGSSSPNKPGRGTNITNGSEPYLHARSYWESLAKSCLDLPTDAVGFSPPCRGRREVPKVPRRRRGASGWRAPSPGCAAPGTRHTLCAPHLTGSSPLHLNSPSLPQSPDEETQAASGPQLVPPLQTRCRIRDATLRILSPDLTRPRGGSKHLWPQPHSRPRGSPGPAREDRTGRRRLVRRLLRAQRLEPPSSLTPGAFSIHPVCFWHKPTSCT